MRKTLFLRFPFYDDKTLLLVGAVSAGIEGLSLTRTTAPSIPRWWKRRLMCWRSSNSCGRPERSNAHSQFQRAGTPASRHLRLFIGGNWRVLWSLSIDGSPPSPLRKIAGVPPTGSFDQPSHCRHREWELRHQQSRSQRYWPDPRVAEQP
jgi:hypothetical protein